MERLLQYIVAAHGVFTFSELSVLLAIEDNLSTIQAVEVKSKTSGNIIEAVNGSFLTLVTGSNETKQVRLVMRLLEIIFYNHHGLDMPWIYANAT